MDTFEFHGIAHRLPKCCHELGVRLEIFLGAMAARAKPDNKITSYSSLASLLASRFIPSVRRRLGFSQLAPEFCQAHSLRLPHRLPI